MKSFDAETDLKPFIIVININCARCAERHLARLLFSSIDGSRSEQLCRIEIAAVLAARDPLDPHSLSCVCT